MVLTTEYGAVWTLRKFPSRFFYIPEYYFFCLWAFWMYWIQDWWPRAAKAHYRSLLRHAVDYGFPWLCLVSLGDAWLQLWGIELKDSYRAYFWRGWLVFSLCWILIVQMSVQLWLWDIHMYIYVYTCPRMRFSYLVFPKIAVLTNSGNHLRSNSRQKIT